ncbi:MAG TPA: hypothetical protein P5200_01470 [Tenuifilaceae bacterium]|nr:hypothetical protein [Tenuifilaceae bacterium]HRX67009.1 hypothetical protein [Tenuifilaceae bacterium]
MPAFGRRPQVSNDVDSASLNLRRAELLEVEDCKVSIAALAYATT